jgi:hypothetical protein
MGDQPARQPHHLNIVPGLTLKPSAPEVVDADLADYYRAVRGAYRYETAAAFRDGPLAGEIMSPWSSRYGGAERSAFADAYGDPRCRARTPRVVAT